MARAKILTFKRLSRVNNFPRLQRAARRDLSGPRNLALEVAKFTRARARSLQKPAPKKPAKSAGLYGNIRSYRPGSAKYRANKFYWKKGLYSRPGQAPFYHGKAANPYQTLRGIIYEEIQSAQVTIPINSRGAFIKAYIVGPLHKPSRDQVSVPALHEHGGTVRLTTMGNQTYKARNGVVLRRRNPTTATYPRRPYMEPAADEARRSVRRKFGNIAGMKPSRLRIA